ncbi:MAG: radical SAM protein [Verrucomicrobiota bacterium]
MNAEVPTPVALRYQDQRGLDQVPAYATGLQLRIGDSRQVYVALSATELTLYFEPQLALHYDLEGRLVKVADATQFWRRGLSGRMLLTRKMTEEEGGGIARAVVPIDMATGIISDAHRRTQEVHAALRDGRAVVELGRPSVPEAQQHIAPLLELAAGFDAEASEREAEKFRQIYGRVAVLPPDQYNALVLQATEGCAYAGCTFCDLYKGVVFRRKSLEEFRDHIRAVLKFHGDSLRARRSIFLGEANALTQPAATLKDFFHVLNEHFEFPATEMPSTAVSASWWLGSSNRFDGVSSFMDAFANPNRTVGDYFDLRRLGLRRVYVGLESGDAGLLKWLKKPATIESAQRCIQLLKQSDILVGVIVLIGAGGREYAAAHVRETARVLNELPLARNDHIFFSPLHVYPGGQYNVQAMTDAVTPLTRAERLLQEQEIRQALRFDSRRGKPFLSQYELETFVY